jgi:hypothetical protein
MLRFPLKRAALAACGATLAGLLLFTVQAAAQGSTDVAGTAPAASTSSPEQHERGKWRAPGGPPATAGLDLMASFGYGNATTKERDLELDPYGATFGFDVGYTFRFGLRLGARAGYGVGRSVSQSYDPTLGRTRSLTTESESVSSGVSLGYDLPLYFLVLRYSLDMGGTWLNYDLGAPRFSALAGYSPTKGTLGGFYLAPRLVLLWPITRFQCGIGLQYLLHADERIPSGMLGELLVGVRL